MRALLLTGLLVAVPGYPMWGCPQTIMGPYLPPSATHTEGEKLRQELHGQKFSLIFDGKLQTGVIESVSDPNVAWAPERKVQVTLNIGGKLVYVDGVSVAALQNAGATPPAFPGMLPINRR